MIKDLKIENFKGFKKFEIYDFKQVNLITGKNNTGKSTLLEAIACFVNPAFLINRHVGKFVQQLTPFPNTNQIPNPLEILPHLFRNLDISQEILLEIPSLEEKILISYKELQLINNMNAYELNFTFSKNNSILRQTYNPTNPQMQQIVKPNEMIKFIFEFYTYKNLNINLPQILDKIIDDVKAYEELIKSLKEIEPSLIDLRMGKGNTIKYRLKSAENVGFLINSTGDGLNNFLSIILSLYNARNGILLIDEIDNGFHYSVLPYVWKVILTTAKEFNVQVFATTHSYECIMAYYDSFKKQQLEETFINYYRLSKNEDNDLIEYTQLTPDELEASFRMNLEIRGN